ncbi:MAG: ABC transporter permease [Frankia sp.]
MTAVVAAGGHRRYDPARPVRFRDIAGGEWIKLRTLRSTGWSFTALVFLSTGFTAIATAVYSGQWNSLSAQDRADAVADPIGLILQPGVAWGQIALCVLGVLLFGGEYSTGMIRSSVLAVPDRRALLVAKGAVFGGLTFVVAEVTAFGSFLLGRSILSAHVGVSLDDAITVRALVGYGLYLTLTAWLALAIGAVIRHVAAAVTVVLGLVLVLPVVSGFLPGRSGDYVSAYLPGGQAGQMIVTSGNGAGWVIGPWPGLAVAGGWTLLALIIAGRQLSRRDV